MSESAWSSRFDVEPTVMIAEVGGEAVLLHGTDGAYFGLNAVAVRAWKVLAEGGSFAECHERLLQEFDVEPGRLQADLQALISDLERLQLIIRRSA